MYFHGTWSFPSEEDNIELRPFEVERFRDLCFLRQGLAMEAEMMLKITRLWFQIDMAVTQENSF